MKLAKKRFKDKASRHQWVYGELDRMYPPFPDKKVSKESRKSSYLTSLSSSQSGSTAEDGQTQTRADDGSIQGLSDIPEDWPELPANASLSSDVGWVQANRLRVVEERTAGPTLVHLSQALSPAPSWAALGWLETSIRSYAKYVDVAAKATSSDDGEAGVMRRERMAIDEVDALLAEMMDDEG